MLKEGLLDACKPLLQQPELMDRRKGLLAISAIVRGYTPAMAAFFKDPQLLSCTLAQVRVPICCACIFLGSFMKHALFSQRRHSTHVALTHVSVLHSGHAFLLRCIPLIDSSGGGELIDTDICALTNSRCTTCHLPSKVVGAVTVQRQQWEACRRVRMTLGVEGRL